MAGISNTTPIFPMTLDNPTSVVVARPSKNEREKDEEEHEEVLVIEGIEVNRNEFVKFDVFINDEDEVETGGGGAARAEFAGSFVNVPHRHKDNNGGDGGKVIKTRLRMGISELLEGLGVEDDDADVVVKLVPRCDNVLVKIGGIKIEIE